jgi:endonuclease/exonuclease/phosphatase family metal-dependent hydrolase
VLALLVVWQGSTRVPSGADSGIALNPWQNTLHPAASWPANRIRLGTYNIHSSRGLDGKIDIERIAANLRGLDFVGLNEVRGRGWLGQSDQAEQLGRRLEADWLFAPTEWRWWHDDFGNGVISRLKVRSWQRIPLPHRNSRSCRNAVLVAADVGGRPLNLLVAHVERDDPQAAVSQLQAVVDLFLSLQPPAVLLGDMNAVRGEPQLRRLLATPGVADPLATLPHPDLRIDWIVTRGLETTDRGFEPRGPSDHPHFWVECRLVD